MLRHLIIPVFFTEEHKVSNEEHCRELDISPSNSVPQMAVTVNLDPRAYEPLQASHTYYLSYLLINIIRLHVQLLAVEVISYTSHLPN